MARDPFHPGAFYHIYNRGNNRENLFLEPANYYYFLDLYRKYLYATVSTYAYCLLPNHFHFLIRIRDPEMDESGSPVDVSKQFATCFGTYAKAINYRYQRTGRLFEERINRKQVPTENYFTTLVVYIHRNPQTHGLLADFRDWTYSSYPAFRSSRPTRLERETVFDWFGGRAAFIEAHERPVETGGIEDLLFQDPT